MASIEQAVRCINSSAEVRHTSFAEISPDWVLDSDSYSLTHMKSLPMLQSSAADHDHTHDHDHSHSHSHDHSEGECEHCPPPSSSSSSSSAPQPHSAASLSTHSFLIPGHMDLHRLKICLDRLLYSFEEDDDEEEGSGEGGSVVGSKRTHHGSAQGSVSSLDTPPPPPSAAASGAAEQTTTSEKAGEKAGESSQCRIYRMKGVFQVVEETTEAGAAGGVALHILQAVHDVFDIQRSDVVPGSEGDKSEGLNKLIVIGKHMDKALLEAEFRHCLLE